jgi:uncharacterized membrane protein
VSMGPVEYVVISFPGNRFDGRIVPELVRLVSTGTVRIIDLVFVSKDESGSVTALEYEELDGEAAEFASLDGEAGSLFSEEDILIAAEQLEPGSSGVFILWEDLWATPLAEAVRDADGMIVAGGRIPHAVVQAALAHSGADPVTGGEG